MGKAFVVSLLFCSAACGGEAKPPAATPPTASATPSASLGDPVAVVDAGVQENNPGRGEGIGLGNIGTLGDGGTGQGFGNGSGRLGGVSAANGGSSIRQGATQVNGRLPPEVIQRIARQNFGKFRLCYEDALRTTPTLEGRVAVKFVIDRAGAVSSAADGGSDIGDAKMIACVVKGFSAMKFPQPEGGIVTVVYPLVFSPATDDTKK